VTSADLARKLRASTVAVQGSDRGGGSGVIWRADGLIVTNAHVVRSSDPIVVLGDGRKLQANVVKHDRRRDLAILQILASGLGSAEVADSAKVRVGQLVMAVGNPMGVAGAVATGVIFAAAGERWIQASVRLAPGNSGGILADSEGRVIGINTMIHFGLAHAIPSNAVASFIAGAANIGRTRAA
jgi:serine protease Do